MKWVLILAQLLGFFPVASLWGSNSYSEMKIERCSLQMAFSWITFIVRIALKFLITFALLNTSLDQIPQFDQSVVHQGFGFMFATGVFYHALALFQTKEFLILLQNLEEYDQLYQKKGGKKIEVIRSPFLTSNIMFWIANIGTPIAALVYFSIKAVARNFGDPNYQWLIYVYSNLWSKILMVSVLALVVIWYEMASLFVISQLVYMVKGLEHRMEDILEAVEKHIHESYQDMKGRKLSTLMHAQPAPMFQKGVKWKLKIKRQPHLDFRTGMNQKYLDYTSLFESFTKFSGIYFVVLFPLQVIASVLIIYLKTATSVFAEAHHLEQGSTLVMGLGLLRIWSMCNLGHRLEKIHSKMMRTMLGVSECKIDNGEEKAEFERCLRIMESIPIQVNASGYFNIGRGNAPNIITAIVSYIIVLLQFKGAVHEQGESVGESNYDPQFTANTTSVTEESIDNQHIRV